MKNRFITFVKEPRNFSEKKAFVGQEVLKNVSMYPDTKNRLVKPNDCSSLGLPICVDAAYT